MQRVDYVPCIWRHSIYIYASSTLVFRMCTFYAQLKEGEGFVTIDFFFCRCHLVSLLRFRENHFWMVWVRYRATTLIIQMLIKATQIPVNTKSQRVRNIVIVLLCVFIGLHAHWAGHCNGALSPILNRYTELACRILHLKIKTNPRFGSNCRADRS